MNTRTKRNVLIELFRFIAALSIAVYHFEFLYMKHSMYLPHFYVWVEFFFIISGFFLIKNIEKNENKNEKSALLYVFGEFKKLYPIYILGFIFSFSIYQIFNKIPFSLMLKNLWNAKYEITLLSILGFDNFSYIYNLGGGALILGHCYYPRISFTF